jgi:hypothetical protein
MIINCVQGREPIQISANVSVDSYQPSVDVFDMPVYRVFFSG